MRPDRQIHAHYRGMEVVRYDRAGRWYLEPLDGSLPRQAVSVDDAARMACWGQANANGEVFFGRLGGKRFDELVRRRSA